MINPSQHTLNQKAAISWITWMNNVNHQQHVDIGKLNKHDTIKIIHSLKNVTT